MRAWTSFFQDGRNSDETLSQVFELASVCFLSDTDCSSVHQTRLLTPPSDQHMDMEARSVRRVQGCMFQNQYGER